LDENGQAPTLWYQFFHITMLVCIAEIGDRSQVSIIYISGNTGVIVALISIVLSNILLSITSVLCGKLLATRFSVRTMTIISGWMFVFLGIVAMIMSIIEDTHFLE
jgi:putative Ca2+/H+ antiporter (TMEM165/GDT1 family)